MTEFMLNLSSDNPFYDNLTSCPQLTNELDPLLRSQSQVQRKKQILKDFDSDKYAGKCGRWFRVKSFSEEEEGAADYQWGHARRQNYIGSRIRR